MMLTDHIKLGTSQKETLLRKAIESIALLEKVFHLQQTQGAGEQELDFI